jgi:hypothetical protein
MAALSECVVYARTAIDARAFAVDRTDLGGKRLVLALIPGPGYPIEPAHHRDVVFGLVYFDELEDVHFRPEANRMAFLGVRAPL